MNYRSVENRCAFNLSTSSLCEEETLSILESNGFKIIDVNIITLARDRIGKSTFKRGSYPNLAPSVVDCSGFTKWLYGQMGVWIPRRSIQQSEYGMTVSNLSNIVFGDLLFTTGPKNYYRTEPAKCIGHVGIATGKETVIHASGKKRGVIETPIDKFFRKGNVKGISRIVKDFNQLITVEIPNDYYIESSDDIFWKIVQWNHSLTTTSP